VLSVLTVVGLYVWLMVWAFTMAAAVGGGALPTAMNQAQLSRLGERLLEERRDGRLPDHLLRPTARDRTPMAWMRDSSSDDATSRRVAGQELVGFASLPASERMQLVDQAVSELVAPDAPHRVWDTVFLLPGSDIDPEGPFDDLWLIASAPFGEAVPWEVLTLAAEYLIIEPEEQAAELLRQNQLRSQAGLNPIFAPLHAIDERGAAVVERERAVSDPE